MKTKTEKHIETGMGGKAAALLWDRVKKYAADVRAKHYTLIRSGKQKPKSARMKREEEMLFDELALVLSWAVCIPVDQVKRDAVDAVFGHAA